MPNVPQSPPIPYARQILDLVASPSFLRATFGGSKRAEKTAKFKHAVVRLVELSGGMKLQASRFEQKKDLTTNYELNEAQNALADILAAGFANVHVTLQEEEVDVRLSKKGELFIGRKQRTAASPIPQPSTAHDRAKSVCLPEGLTGGQADRLLLAMGIVDRTGHVRPAMRDKFTQINEFLKLLNHVLPEISGDYHDRPLTILDCGCGASYLTLAAWHYLTHVKGLAVNVIGVDANEEVIAKAQARALDLGCGERVRFRTAKIGTIDDIHPDIVLALHACDTATDDALAQGIRANAKLILAVPCCHQDLNRRLRIDALAPLHRHGILHERLADLVTDSLRALLLKVMGYRAEVVEFISPEHTAKNLMIRAVKVRPAPDPAAWRDYQSYKKFIGVTPYLETAIGPIAAPASPQE